MLRYVATAAIAAALTAAAMAFGGQAKRVPARHYEINGGLAGAVTHRERIIATSGERWRSVRARRWIARNVPVAAWERVRRCEEPSWFPPHFANGLGILPSTWRAYAPWWFPTWHPSKAEQVVVAMRIQSTPPDAYGCAGW